MKYDFIIVGCGFAGSVVARYLAEERNLSVLMLERRDHIAGNMYDYVDNKGIRVQKYGPHTFHTKDKNLFDYVCRYGIWEEYNLTCMAQIDGIFTPTPFNYRTIDQFYSKEDAAELKERLENYYNNQKTETIVRLLESSDSMIQKYAQFLYDKDYSLYTAKQWGISPKEIDISVLQRVPVRFSYEDGYFDKREYQIMPKNGFTSVFENILNHPNITVQLKTDVREHLSLNLEQKTMYWDGKVCVTPILYTGPLDELLNYQYGLLPYRSLRFDFQHKNISSFQDAPVVAYPQADEFTRITEYTKLPIQKVGNITSIAVEYPLQYNPEEGTEPYYPIITESNREQHKKYQGVLNAFDNLFLCGRLADFQYYNMDRILKRSLDMCTTIGEWLDEKKE